MMETSDTHGKMSKACDDVSSEQVRGSANTLSFPIVTYLNVPIQIFLTIRGHKFGPFSSEFLMKNLIRKDLKLLKAINVLKAMVIVQMVKTQRKVSVPMQLGLTTKALTQTLLSD